MIMQTLPRDKGEWHSSPLWVSGLQHYMYLAAVEANPWMRLVPTFCDALRLSADEELEKRAKPSRV